MAYADYIGEIKGTIPRISILHAGQLLNRAWGRIRDSRLWSFNVVPDGQLFVPAVITAGTLHVTFGSPTVTTDATAAAAIDAVALSNPPAVSPILGVGRQIKVAGGTGSLQSTAGPAYTPVSWDGVSTLTLDRPFGEASQAAASYQMLKCYFAPPLPPPGSNPANYDQSFIRYCSIINPVTGYTIRGKKLWYTNAELNAIDPQRGGQGDAYIVSDFGRNSLGQSVKEFYPNPVSQATYLATYITRWADLSPTVDLPPMPYDLAGCVLHLAKVFACQWASANVSTDAGLGQTNWIATQTMFRNEFRDSLIQCVKQDDEIRPLLPFKQGSAFDFPLGGQFLQGHDISSLVP